MKTRLIIGDVHGRWNVVKTAYDVIQPNDVIILGDYMDSHDDLTSDEIHSCFKNIIKLKKQHKNGEFICLLGNHDFHYLYNKYTEKYSSFDSNTLKWAFNELKKYTLDGTIQLIYFDKKNNIIYSHAGISDIWLNDYGLQISDLNNLLLSDTLYPLCFTYGSNLDPCGDDVVSSCIWIRPFSLLKSMNDNYTQVVGHTQTVKGIVGINKKDFPVMNKVSDINNSNLILCDALPNYVLVEYLNDDNTLHHRDIVNLNAISGRSGNT